MGTHVLFSDSIVKSNNTHTLEISKLSAVVSFLFMKDKLHYVSRNGVVANKCINDYFTYTYSRWAIICTAKKL